MYHLFVLNTPIRFISNEQLNNFTCILGIHQITHNLFLSLFLLSFPLFFLHLSVQSGLFLFLHKSNRHCSFSCNLIIIPNSKAPSTIRNRISKKFMVMHVLLPVVRFRKSKYIFEMLWEVTFYCNVIILQLLLIFWFHEYILCQVM